VLEAAGVALSNIVATLQDPTNAIVSSYGGGANIGIAANPGSSTLSGTTAVTAVNGVATFSTLSLNKAANAYTLQVSGGSATTAITNAFNIVAAPAANLALQSGNLQNATPGTMLTNPIVVLVTDALGNPVSGKTVTFAIASGGGSVGSASTTSNASGLAQSTWTLGGGAGAQTLTVAAVGLLGSPITATANSGGTVASTIVAPHVDTLTASTTRSPVRSPGSRVRRQSQRSTRALGSSPPSSTVRRTSSRPKPAARRTRSRSSCSSASRRSA
jgi:hypothetical protein